MLDDLVRRIAERFAPDKIILFGSRARGDAAAIQRAVEGGFAVISQWIHHVRSAILP